MESKEELEHCSTTMMEAALLFHDLGFDCQPNSHLQYPLFKC